MKEVNGKRVAIRCAERTARKPFDIVKLEVMVPGLPEAFEGYRIAQLSDLHLGPLTPESHISASLDATNELAPNIVLITGDLIQAGKNPLNFFLNTRVSPRLFGWIDYRRAVRGLADRLCELLASLRAPDGLLGVLGNHDYMEGLGTILRRLGERVNFLRNQSFDVRRGGEFLRICGIDDFREGDPCLRTTIGRLGTDDAPSSHPFMKILLSHNPDVVLHEDAHLLDDFDLVLCGHTHGGQIRFPVLGALMTSTTQKHHVNGLSSYGDTPFYVTTGVGYGLFSVRFMCPPEVVLLTLTGA